MDDEGTESLLPRNQPDDLRVMDGTRVGQAATLYFFQVKMLRFKYAFHEALKVALNAMKVSQQLGKRATLA